jgi:thimet oligopeptidase
MAYRKAVLEPGGSESADELIEHFLGRPMSTEAFRQMLQGQVRGEDSTSSFNL